MVGRTLVVGGGITGLAAAHQLHLQGDDFVLLEASRRLGGKVVGGPVEGSALPFDVDAAADGFLAREPEMADLCVELGLGDDLVSPVGAGAFLWIDGVLQPVPRSVLGVPLDPDDPDLEAVVSAPGVAEFKARALAEQPALVGDATVGEVVRARAGDEVFERLVDPLLGGICAGSSDKLSITAAARALADAARRGGSFLLALQAQRAGSADSPVFLGVRGGSQRIIDALHEELAGRVRLNTPVDSLHRSSGRWWVGTPHGPFDGDRVVVTTPASMSAPLLAPHSREAAKLLIGLVHADVVLVTFVVGRDQVDHDLNGAGFLVPRDQGLLMTACSWASSKWGHYDDGAHAVVRVSAGRIDDQRWLHLDRQRLVETLRKELASTIGLHGEAAVRVTPWYRSLPQYRLGHLARCDRIDDCLARDAPGITVAGASMRGLGLPACVRQARHAVRQCD